MRWFQRSVTAVQPQQSDRFSSACSEALPVIAAHIDTAQDQLEAAVSSLSSQFAGTVARLDDALALSSGMALDDQGGLSLALAAGKSQLQQVVAGLKQISASRGGLNEQIREVAASIKDLRDMADEVGQIAFKTNMLSLNAAIEATHAGEAGKGFAVVAQEVRALSRASRETGRRINERVTAMSEMLSSLTLHSDAALTKEIKAVDECDHHIGEVLARFGVVSLELAQMAGRLRSESSAIKSELESSLVQLQFQDRVSQILRHAAHSLRELGQAAQQPGTLDAESLAALLAGLAEKYTTEEQRQAHLGAVPLQSAAGVTFF